MKEIKMNSLREREKEQNLEETAIMQKTKLFNDTVILE